MFDLMFVGEQEIAVLTITAGVIERNQVQGVHMNDQRNFALASLDLAGRTTPESIVGIRVEGEFILKRQGTKKDSL